ncbi:hypothetical protein GCM10009547_29940 [Sporichthya brevicatena]|uniref:ABM domain-containing protein n=1 Tax=Sporichthya brevicatena TaxID=171442 RepID=A0ABN1H0P5_9ACTN
MPGFIQTITYTTSRIDEVRQLNEDYRARRMADGADLRPVQVTLCTDHEVPNRYTVLVEFNSYEDAMANSNHPATSEFAQQMQKLCDGPPTFVNLDVVERLQP